jgi:hypothetical protein
MTNERIETIIPNEKQEHQIINEEKTAETKNNFHITELLEICLLRHITTHIPIQMIYTNNDAENKLMIKISRNYEFKGRFPASIIAILHDLKDLRHKRCHHHYYEYKFNKISDNNTDFISRIRKDFYILNLASVKYLINAYKKSINNLYFFHSKSSVPCIEINKHIINIHEHKYKFTDLIIDRHFDMPKYKFVDPNYYANIKVICIYSNKDNPIELSSDQYRELAIIFEYPTVKIIDHDIHVKYIDHERVKIRYTSRGILRPEDPQQISRSKHPIEPNDIDYKGMIKKRYDIKIEQLKALIELAVKSSHKDPELIELLKYRLNILKNPSLSYENIDNI